MSYLRDIRVVHQLFILNICLQVFDGIATYVAVGSPAGEGNPLLAAIMMQLGIGTSLLLFKLKACGFLYILRHNAGHALVGVALVVIAAVYSAMSFVPWSLRILEML
jgi:Na+-transporting NADH:ubiquinone oxidoreductase subunit NqrE